MIAAAIVAGASVPAGAATGTCVPGAETEVLRYEWRLQGLHGFLARLLRILPSSGEATMSRTRCADGRLRFEFLATSPAAAPDESWHYVAETDRGGRHTRRVEETLVYKGKERRKETDFEEEVVDILTGLQLIRREPPASPQRLLIWSDGKIYPVIVVPRGIDQVEGAGGAAPARHYSIRGLREKGQRLWKSEGEIWLDTASDVPVEILLRRGLGRILLDLAAPGPDDRTPAGRDRPVATGLGEKPG